MEAILFRVSGTVQGVGFRPFVHNLATRLGLAGWVCNTSGSVEIVIEGESPALASFTNALRAEAPPLAQIDLLEWESIPAAGYATFEIRASIPRPGDFQPIAPDIAICSDCERELFDPADRRYLYPFINCTHCGPRLTIIRDIPYDRARTSMAPFEMCARCRVEYENPNDRRFDAQPIACPDCGPRVWIVGAHSGASAGAYGSTPAESQGSTPAESHGVATVGAHGDAPLPAARRLLREGRIVAIRGMGGFHLACDAANPDAVRELRRRKRRSGKPFAVMARDLAVAELLCEIGDAERALLTGREKPIVILRRKAGCPVAAEAAPGNGTLGVMLPYSPLHLLLLYAGDPILGVESAPAALVMTSGNLSEEPIAIGNDEAIARLGPLADAFLLHDREIIQRCDDSVMRIFIVGSRAIHGSPVRTQGHLPSRLPSRSGGSVGSGESGAMPIPLRRSRGYAPAPVVLPFDSPPILAVGGELKNTFCLARGRYAFLSPHIGDMENAETLAAFEESVERYQRLFHTKPEIIAHDLHPGYLGTRWACDTAHGRKLVPVQHHHAHAAACMADNELSGKAPVTALAFDGTGYGSDGVIWGAEILVADYRHYERLLHLEYLPLPGGDAAIRRPWRIALGFAAALDLPVADLPFLKNQDAREAETVRAQIARGLNTPLVSSMGRLFDAVAALAGICSEIDYEAQGAIELEELARGRIGAEDEYPFTIEGENIRVRDLLAAVIDDVRAGIAADCIGARFHRSVRSIAVQSAQAVRAARGIRAVALSGGVWQNALLLELTAGSLREAGFEVYTHRRVPANDGGLALGQAAVAAAMEV